jgi:hypothetical protein
MAVPKLNSPTQPVVIDVVPESVVESSEEEKLPSPAKPSLTLVPPPKPLRFKWTAKAKMALKLLQEREMEPEAIAKEVGTSYATLVRWTANPAFGYDEHLFLWTAQKEKAAALLAVGERTNGEIAKIIGCNEDRLSVWKRFPAFTEKIAENVAEIRRGILSTGIADKANRIARYNERFEQLEQVRQARARAYADNAAIPGGGTGIVQFTTRTMTEMGEDGERRQVTRVECHIDVASLREELALMRQAAIEAGDWSERPEHTHQVLIRSYGGPGSPVDIDRV